jgi:NAD(P)-dependent dehydrogenase (short-subunit alcohol dehydrogenase family)
VVIAADIAAISSLHLKNGFGPFGAAARALFSPPMKSNLEANVALVTGGTSGIGRAAALAFAREGMRVVVSGRREKEGSAVAAEINSSGGEAIFVRADVTREAEVADLVTRTVSHFGRLDVAFNNAGMLGPLAPVTELTTDTYERVFDANVRGVFFALKHEIPAMLKNGGGAIVNNASIGGSIGFPNFSLYVASKHAVVGLTRSAALEFAPRGVRVNAVSPAGIQTDMFDSAFGRGETDAKRSMAALHPVGRIGSPEEVAEAVLWLCSPRASFVTGHDLLVDGGFTAQ